LRLQDLRELWRIGANCNYRCNYKPIWLTWRSGGLPTQILPLLDGSGQDCEGDQTGPGNESGRESTRSLPVVHSRMTHPSLDTSTVQA
jgi:hypothetical protein